MRPAASLADHPVRTRSRHRPRLLSVVRLGWGLSLLRLTAPNATNAMSGLQDDPPLRMFTRILGARHLLEACALIVIPSRRALRAGSVIDTIHTATMLGVAGVDRRRRDLALAHAAVAACWAIAADTVGLELPTRGGGL